MIDEGPNTWAVVALFLSIASMVLAVVAYWRTGGRDDMETLRRKQQLLVEELARRTRRGLEDSLARARRLDQRLEELRAGAAAELRDSIDSLSSELAALKREAEIALERLKVEVTAGAHTSQEILAKRVHHIEGTLRVVAARAEIDAAELLADAARFDDAEDMLEDAVAKVREAQLRLSGEEADEPAFGPVIDALHDALRSVRARADDRKRQLDTVLAASDSLLASLRAHERSFA